MELEQIINLIMNNGVTVCVLAYFIWRDKSFMTKLDATLEKINDFINRKE